MVIFNLGYILHLLMSKYPLQSSSDAKESNPYLNRAHMRRFGKQPFAWNGKNAGDGNHTADDSKPQNNIDAQNTNQNKNGTSDGDSQIQTCRNSVQGRVLIADDQGTILYISY